jgi:hypothetical protein
VDSSGLEEGGMAAFSRVKRSSSVKGGTFLGYQSEERHLQVLRLQNTEMVSVYFIFSEYHKMSLLHERKL